MTAHRVTELRCNGSQCDNALTWYGNADRIREHARRNCGWIVAQPGGVDFCSPTCLNTPRSTNR